MSKKNILLNNDGLYNEYREECEESIDFFTGSKIEVSDKKHKEEDSDKDKIEGSEDISGLETLVVTFGGGVGVRDVPIFPYEKVNEMNNEIYNLFQNKIKKLEKRINYTTQKLDKKGIKEKPIKLKQVVKRLGIPKKVTSDPKWVLNSIYEAIYFYLLTVKAQEILITYSKENPDTSEKYLALQFDILEKLGKVFSSSSANKGVYTSKPLPGNKTFNLRISKSIFSNSLLTYFIDLKTPVESVSEFYTPDINLINSAIKYLKECDKLITNNQKYSLVLGVDLNKKLNPRYKKPKERRFNRYGSRYYLWLANLNKRLVTTSLQYIISTTEALDDFINQGIK